MDESTRQRLIALNHLFYQKFALAFSMTRQRLQPGVQRMLKCIPTNARLLDLGCGNGEVWRILQAVGFRGLYVGLDFSTELLHLAASGEREYPTSLTDQILPISDNIGPPRAYFLQADLSAADWNLTLAEQHFEVVLAFAVLHHLPGYDLRLEMLRKVRQLLTADGHFIHSNWQFLNSTRLRARIQPWETIGLSASQVEPGDYLLDWRRGGYGLRYVHHFDQNELSHLAEGIGFKVSVTFLSDGENGNLGLYQIWEK